MAPRIVLEAQGVRVLVGAGAGALRRRRTSRAIVDGVSLRVEAGQVLAVVGESGAGKTTLGRVLVGLQRPHAGRVLLEGDDLYALTGAARQAARRKVQMVYQDPYDSLPPRMTVRQIVAEPLRAHRLEPEPEARARRVAEALESVELAPAAEYLDRRPSQLSGGQRQRVALAAALVVEPIALVADEPVAMLDLSLRAGILALLRDLAQRRGLGVLLITHDLGTVAHYSQRLAVMYAGRVVEAGPTRPTLARPAHPYLRDLLDALASLDGADGDASTPISTQVAGCRYGARCRLAESHCAAAEPALRPVGAQREAACFLAKEVDGECR